MDNVITITLDDKKLGKRNMIRFQSNPTLCELCAACLVLEEVLEHNFSKASILEMRSIIYKRLENLEEVGAYWIDKS